MALDDYAGLQIEIGDWLNRQDLAAKIPTFIRLLESQVNRKLRTHQMMQRATADITDLYTALPDDFRALYTVILQTNPITPLEYATPGELSDVRSRYSPQKPFLYSVVGSAIEVAPAPDTSYPMEITYWQQIPYLSDIAPTNWLLTEHPDVYLFGALMQAAPYLNNDDRVGVWGTALNGILEEIQISDERALKGGVPLKSRIKPYGG